jgi:N-acetylmuramoyl-L-alanine amidase CwlA
MNIEKRFLTINEMSRPGYKLDSVSKIVVHYVANPGSTAIQNRNYFESLSRQSEIYASAHYIVGLKGEIIQCIPENEVAYHSGNEYMNYNSIGIENCHPTIIGKFTNSTINSLVLLIADICKRYNLNPETDIIRHYDVNGKICPRYYVYNILAWNQIKRMVANEMNK